MKTAVASDPGDDDEGRQVHCPLNDLTPGTYLPIRADAFGTPMQYNGGAVPTTGWLTTAPSGWQQTGGAAPTSRMLGVSHREQMSAFMSELAAMNSDPDSGIDVAFTIEVMRVAGQAKTYDPSWRSRVTIDKSAPQHQPSRHPWSAKLGLIRLTMHLFCQGGWIRLPSLSPNWLTRAAVRLAGKNRRAVCDEWRSHLYGWPDRRLSQKEQLGAARAFLLTAVRYRLQDAADLGWQAVDAVLKSRTLSNLFIWIPVLAAMLAVVHHDGLYGLITNAENLTALWGIPFAAIKVGRRCRRVKPERKPRPAKR